MSEIKTTRIRIEDLIVDPSIEIRSEERSKEVIEGLSEAREELPPIVVDQNYRVIDGIHRLEAHKINGDEEVDAEVIVAADDISAIMIALRRNSTHGVKLSGKSRKANAFRLFDAGKTISEIGEALGVNDRSVRRYFEEENARIKEKQQQDVVHLYQTGMEMQDIADAVSREGIREISRSTVSRYVGGYLKKEIADRLEKGWDIDGIEKSLHGKGFGRYLKDNPGLLQGSVEERLKRVAEADDQAEGASESLPLPDDAVAQADEGVDGEAEDESPQSGVPETLAGSDAESGVVVDAEKKAAKTTEHKEMQWMLLWLGNEFNLDLWLPRTDFTQSHKKDEIASLTGMLQTLPVDILMVGRSVEVIDVLWLKDEKIVAAFEVEHSTGIASGLFRMSHMWASLKDSSMRTHIVAPDKDVHNTRDKANVPTYTHNGLAESCWFIPYTKLTDKFREARQSGSLPSTCQDLLDEIAFKL